MKYKKKPYGFTLLEIMFTVAIVGILAAIAVPSYSEYIKQTYLNTAEQKAEHLQLLLQDYWEDNETYITGNDETDTHLQTKLGWHSGDSNITSKVEAGTTHSIESSFKITITHSDVADRPIIINYAR